MSYVSFCVALIHQFVSGDIKNGMSGDKGLENNLTFC